jgi:hypothetical protein
MTDQQRPPSTSPAPPPAGPPAPAWPGPAGGQPAAPPTPAPASRRSGLLFGCLGAGLLVLLLGLVAAGGAIYLTRRTVTRAQRALATSVVSAQAIATSVASTAGRPTPVIVAGGARSTTTGATVVARGSAPATATSLPIPGAAGVPLAPTSRPAAAHPAGLNQPVVIPNWTVSVTGVERPGQELAIAADNSNDPVTAAGTWVVVALSVTRTTNGAEGIGYDDVALRSGQGFTYAIPVEYWTLDDFYPAFKHSQPYGKVVPPGATVTYYLTFDVAPDATDLQFIFLPDTANPAVVAIGGAAAAHLPDTDRRDLALVGERGGTDRIDLIAWREVSGDTSQRRTARAVTEAVGRQRHPEIAAS